MHSRPSFRDYPTSVPLGPRLTGFNTHLQELAAHSTRLDLNTQCTFVIRHGFGDGDKQTRHTKTRHAEMNKRKQNKQTHKRIQVNDQTINKQA